MTGISRPVIGCFTCLPIEGAIALVVRVHRDRHVGEHRLGPRGRDFDRARSRRRADIAGPELALDLARLDLEVADRGLELGVPVHQPLVAVEQPALVELDEHLE